MNRFKELRAELKKLNGLQWSKKQSLRRVISNNAGCQRRINRNMVVGPEGHAGAKYVPWDAAKYLVGQARAISSLTKDLNQRRMRIRQLESELQMLKDAMSMDAFFQRKDGVGKIIGIHAVGFKGPDGEFYQEEIWANQYLRKEDGSLEMSGGSMRVHGPFEVVALDYRNDAEWQEVRD